MIPDAITLGIAISLSGRYALLGRQVLEGLECYIRDVNAAGGIRLQAEHRPLPVSLIVEDDESDETKVRGLTEQLIARDQVDLLMGPYGSGLTLAAAETAEAAQQVLWNHSGQPMKFSSATSPGVVGLLSPASQYLCAILELLRTLDPEARRVALLSAKTGFATDMASGALAWIQRHGLTLNHQLYRSGLDDFSPLLNPLKADPPDWLLSVGRVEDDLRLGPAVM